MIPDRLPRLARGLRPPGSGEVCAEQAVAWLVSGRLDLGELTDHPSCVHPVLNALSIVVNDTLPDSERHRMWPLILAQPGTARPEMEPMLSIWLGLWCARQVEHLMPPEGWAANDATEAWWGCPCVAHAMAAKAAAAAADRAGWAARAAADAARAAAGWNTEWAAEAAKSAAAEAAKSVATEAAEASRAAAGRIAVETAGWAARAAALIDLLAGAQAEHARLTGHVAAPVDLARIERLGELVGWAP